MNHRDNSHQSSSGSSAERLRIRRERRARRLSQDEGSSSSRQPSEVKRKPIDQERRTRQQGPAPERISMRFDEELIDAGALKVVSRLNRAGYEAYMVGGCVRDLLVGHRPKDFDVATSARPEQVRSLFRNSRIIGRRFRLVHVLFPEGEVIETATFRRNPPPQSGLEAENLLIVSDNYFGRAHEDAQRRDFTINALFYNHEDGVVLDWLGGMQHIEERVVHTIGEPTLRFKEDPIRMLRAIKFASRLDFGMSPEVYEAAVSCRGALAMAARPRVSEEILRLMRGGAAQRAVWLLWEMGMLDILLPEVSAYLRDQADDSAFWNRLTLLDAWTKAQGSPPDDILLWLCLLADPLLEHTEDAEVRADVIEDSLEPIIERLALTRRQADGIRRILITLPKVRFGRAKRFSRSPLYPLAVDFVALDSGRLDISQAHSKVIEERSPRRRGGAGRGRNRR